MAAGASEQARHVWAEVHGRVQGVGFRYFVRDAACRLKLSGWVRNREDGGVELEAQGLPDEVKVFLLEIHEGPPLSYVSDVKVRELPPEKHEQIFEIRF